MTHQNSLPTPALLVPPAHFPAAPVIETARLALLVPGSVERPEAELLFIQRCNSRRWNGTWELPGGKIDPEDVVRASLHHNSYLEAAGLRETTEEIGDSFKKVLLAPDEPLVFQTYQRKRHPDNAWAIGHAAVVPLGEKPREIRLNPLEVTAYQWLSFAAIRLMLEQGKIRPDLQPFLARLPLRQPTALERQRSGKQLTTKR